LVRFGLRHRDLSGIRALGVDEVCVAKEKLWTVVYQIDEGGVACCGSDRDCEDSSEVAAKLMRMGIGPIALFEGGWDERSTREGNAETSPPR